MRKKFSVILLSLSLLLAACSSGSQSSELTSAQQEARDIAKGFCNRSSQGYWDYEVLIRAAKLDSQYRQYAELAAAINVHVTGYGGDPNPTDLENEKMAKLVVFCGLLE